MSKLTDQLNSKQKELYSKFLDKINSKINIENIKIIYNKEEKEVFLFKKSKHKKTHYIIIDDLCNITFSVVTNEKKGYKYIYLKYDEVSDNQIDVIVNKFIKK
jgi:hypothetical protein